MGGGPWEELGSLGSHGGEPSAGSIIWPSYGHPPHLVYCLFFFYFWGCVGVAKNLFTRSSSYAGRLALKKSLGLPISIQWLMSTPMTSQKAQAKRPLTCWISVFFSSAGQVTTRSRHFETLWAPPRSRGSSRWQPKKKNYYILYYYY